jgi:hypothetical protein
MRRVIAAVLAALLGGAFYIALLYVFFTRLWPLLPVWANVVLVILLALAFILSPLFLLLRLGQMQPPQA